MPYTLTQTLKFALGTVFFCFAAFTPSLASAEYLPEISANYQIETCVPPQESPNTGNDGNGYFQNTNNYNICTLSTTTRDFISMVGKKNEDGYKFWAFSRYGIGSGNQFVLVNNFGQAHTLQEVYATTTTDEGIKVFDDVSNIRREVYNGFFDSALSYDTWRLTTVGSGQAYPGPYAYIIAYTNENLYYINTREELYTYLDTRSGLSNPPQTRIIEINNPISGSLQPTTTVNFNFDYYFNDADFGIYTHTTAIVTDLTLGTTVPMFAQEINASGGGTYSQNTTLTQGHFYMWQPKMYGSTTSILGNFQTFDVVTHSGEMSFIPPTSTSTIGELTLECGDGLIVGSICNLMGYLIVPSSNVLNKFSSLWDNIKNKPPFGYVTMTINALTNLDLNSAKAFDLGEVPFKDAIFDPFKIALGSILWAFYAIHFYQKRLKTLDI